MFSELSSGVRLVGQALRAFVRFPSLIVPLLLVWGVATPLQIYLVFDFHWEAHSGATQWAVVVAAFMLYSLLLSFSCFVLLERVRQIEMDERGGLPAALGAAVVNTARALPIVVVWAVLWLVLSVIEAMLDDESDDPGELEYENVATLLAGGGEAFSLWRLSLRALKKGVRMLAFLIFPAIAWEQGAGPVRAMKRGIGVARAHKAAFAAGFVLTEIAALVVFLPPGLLLAASGAGVDVPDAVWAAAIAYCGLAWSFSMLLEQLFTAELYAWHLMWEDARAKAGPAGAPMPRLQDVKRPSIMDGVPDLADVGLP